MEETKYAYSRVRAALKDLNLRLRLPKSDNELYSFLIGKASRSSPFDYLYYYAAYLAYYPNNSILIKRFEQLTNKWLSILGCTPKEYYYLCTHVQSLIGSKIGSSNRGQYKRALAYPTCYFYIKGPINKHNIQLAIYEMRNRDGLESIRHHACLLSDVSFEVLMFYSCFGFGISEEEYQTVTELVLLIKGLDIYLTQDVTNLILSLIIKLTHLD